MTVKEVSSGAVGRTLPHHDCATLCALVRAAVGEGDTHQTRLPRHGGGYPSWDTNGSKDKPRPSTRAQPTWEGITKGIKLTGGFPSGTLEDAADEIENSIWENHGACQTPSIRKNTLR